MLGKLKPSTLRLSKGKLVLMILLLIVLWFVFILRNGVAVSRGNDLSIAEDEFKQLQNENTFLHLEIAHLKSPERIQEIATKKLGMVMPDKFFFANEK